MRTTYEFYCWFFFFFFPVTAARIVITKRHDIKIHLKVYFSFNLSVKWLQSKLIPQHICFLFYLYPLQAKKMLELIWSFLKTKGLRRGAWNLVSVKVGAVFCLVLKQWERKKKTWKLQPWQNPSPHHPLMTISLEQPPWAITHDSLHFMVPRVTTFPRGISGFWPAFVDHPNADNLTSLISSW